MRIARGITLIAAALSSLGSATALLRTDPATNLIRARLVVVSTNATTDITVDGGRLASYTSRMLRAPGDSGASQTGSTMRMSDTVVGQTAEAQFDVILAGVPSGATITWNVVTSGGTDASVEVYSLSDSGSSQLVDRFTLTGATGQFRTDSSRLAAAGAVTVSPVLPHLVIAQFYPWYTLSSWRSPEFADQPAQLYSSDEQADIDRQAAQAASAGIDAFAVSWQGRTNGANVRQMHMVLAAASKAGIRACVYFETFIVNRTNDASQPTDPEFMIQWLEDTVDQYTSHPAYLRINGRPVIFVYAASRLSESTWKNVLAAVRATGRNPLVIGDFFHSRLINVLDGEYQYINVTLSNTDLMERYRTETLRVRTFNLLTPFDARRIWVASVCPGYDDRLLTARNQHLVVDRAGGSVYENQWRAAATMAADWVIITTWNEYFENTQIEPSARYGTVYLDATRKWSASFKSIDILTHRQSSLH